MSSALERRDEALRALARVVAGAPAADCESERVDFKLESGTVHSRTGARQQISPRHEPAAEDLAADVACMANSMAGGVLVVGVDDHKSGGDAFVGTFLDPAWLRERVWALTQPSYAIDEIETIERSGKRLYLINIPPALEEIRSGARLRARDGTRCIDLTGDRAREFLERRRRYDWTAEPSGMRFSDVAANAMSIARQMYAAESGTAPRSDLEILRRLGVVLDSDDNPELSRAGALLVCQYEPDVEQLQLLLTPAEGRPSQASVRGPAPIVPLLTEAFDLLERTAFPPHPIVVGRQRRQTRAIPELAIREALVNAVMHRDYRLARSSIAAVASGDPASAFKVRSPGTLPPGVLLDRLLATPSRPRNPALAQAMRVLGLAEREGIGVDTMYQVMLRDGHPAPGITEDAGDVVVVLTGGRPNPDVRAFFDSLESRDLQLGVDVRATIAITELFASPTLRPERLATVAQCTHDEAMSVLERLVVAGAIERLLNRSRTFRLTSAARARLSVRVVYPSRRAIDDHWELVRAYLDQSRELAREDVSRLLNVSPPRAAGIIRELVSSDRLAFVGPRRGRWVRYRLAGSGGGRDRRER